MPNLYEKLSRRTHALLSDLRHGGFTGGEMPSFDARRGLENTVSTAHYLLRPLIDPVIQTGDVFVDIGCGKGRVLNWVLQDGRARHLYGIEINKTVAARVAHRLRNESRVTIIAGDALSSLPDSATLFYMWNPFGMDLMEQLKAAIIAKYTQLGTLQKIRIIYHFCCCVEVWRNDERCIVTDIDIPSEERQRAALIRFR
ncbi:MAG TPA: methyltransferase domain-containing protein [Labilithrix sp.]|nr:methyltransferase domain-containing protein [Labilithrix sp.]